MVAIEGSVDPDGVCCLSIPNRLLGDWANNREKSTSFVALANEYIVDEAITLNPEAERLEDVLYRKSLGVVSKVRAARGVNRKNVLLIRSTTIAILNNETITFTALFGLLRPENIKRYAGILKIYTIAVPSASGVIVGHVLRVLTAIHRSQWRYQLHDARETTKWKRIRSSVFLYERRNY